MNLIKELNEINQLTSDAKRLAKSDKSEEFITQIGKGDLKNELLRSIREADKIFRQRKIQFSKYMLKAGQETIKEREKKESGEVERERIAHMSGRKRKARKQFKSSVERQKMDIMETSEVSRIERHLEQEKKFNAQDSTEIPNWNFFLEPILRHYLSPEDFRKGESLAVINPNCQSGFDNPNNLKLKKSCIKNLPDNGDFFNHEVQRVIDHTNLFNLQSLMTELDNNLDEFEDRVIPEMIDKLVRNFSIEESGGFKKKLKALSRVTNNEEMLKFIDKNITDEDAKKELKKLEFREAKNQILEITKRNVKEGNITRANKLEEDWEVAKEWLRSPINRSMMGRAVVPEEIAKTLNELQRNVPATGEDNPQLLLNNLDILFRYREMYQFPIKGEKSEGVLAKNIVELYYTKKEFINLEKLKESGILGVGENENTKRYRLALKQRDLLKQKIAQEQIYIDSAVDNAILAESRSRNSRQMSTDILIGKVKEIYEKCLQGDSLTRFNKFIASRGVKTFTELSYDDLYFVEQKFSLEGIQVYSILAALKGKNKERLENLLNGRTLDDLSYKELREIELVIFPSLATKPRLAKLSDFQKSIVLNRAREKGMNIKSIKGLEKLENAEFEKLIDKNWKC